MYGIKELTENYTQEELADGCIHALSEAVPVTERTVGKGNDAETEISAEFTTGIEESTARYQAVIKLDTDRGEFISAQCSCSAFRSDGYICEHVMATQMAWLIKKEGIRSVQDSPLKDVIIKKTGVSDPFVPGILRATSTGLLKLLKAQQKMVFLPEKKTGDILAPGSLSLETHLAYDYEKKLFEFKVSHKRSYVVKDIIEFLNAFKSHRKLSFGKTFEFHAYENLFDEDSRKILEFILEMHNMYERDRENIYYRGTTGNTARYLCARGRYYDALMEMIEGKRLYDISGKQIAFSSEECRPKVNLEKLEYGAVVSMEKMERITQTERWFYFRKENTIYRMPVKEARGFLDFRNLLEKQEEVFVSEKDLPAVCRDVLADFSEQVQLECAGMTLGEYLPPKPDVLIYLDHPQDDMISCKCEACYEQQIYPLGMQASPKDNRDMRYEAACLEQVKNFFHAYDEKENTYYYQGDEGRIYYFLVEILPALEKLGELFISDKLKKLKVKPMSKFSVGVNIESGLLQLKMDSPEFDKEELMEILSSYKRKKVYYRLKNGSFFKMDEEQEKVFLALHECVNGLRRPRDGEWKLPLFRALYLDEMLRDKEAVSFEQSGEYRRLLERMREAGEGEYEPPESLKGILRGYQTNGFKWIKMLKESGLGGILADDMGLGKTLQVLAFLLSEKEAGKTGDEMRTLIITPASLIYNWKKEVEQYTPALRVAMITGTADERKNLIQNKADDAEIWITNYDLLKRDIQWYEEIRFANEILDEAQYIKNQTTHASKSVRLVQSSFRMSLTGTPIENRLSELWSIFDYLMPGFLYPYARFREEIELPVISEQDEEAMRRLQCMVHPFILRRLKREVLKELPEKLEEEISIQLEGEQRKLYDAHAQRLKMYLAKQSKEEFAQGKLEILAELTKLRQLCCHPGMLLEDYNAPNAKLEACMELVKQAIDGGHKVLLFSQFTSMLDIIGQRLKEEKIAYHRIDGSVKKEDRMELVEAFDRDEVPVFCISLKAGGTGLNLTAADVVIHFDPWWNLAAQNQATDRVHRIGQVNTVTVYQLIAANTIEEKIVGLQKQKYKLAEDVLSGEGIASILIDQEEVLSLLD